MSLEDKRKFPRLPFNIDVEYKVLSDDLQDVSLTLTKNISAGGICILSLEKLDIGKNLSLNFSLPEIKEPINATGKVVWIEEFSVGDTKSSKAFDAGIEFTKINESDQQKINQYVISRI